MKTTPSTKAVKRKIAAAKIAKAADRVREKPLFKFPKATGCKCALCVHGRRFKEVAAKLPKKDREWMMAFYNHYRDVSSELEMVEAARAI